MTGGDIVRLEGQGRLAEIVMCAPPVNGLSQAFLAAFNRALDAIPDSARAVVIRSAVPNVFMAGGDIGVMRNGAPDELREYVQSVQSTFTRVESLPLPVVGAIDGACLGGGLELALVCDIRVASDVVRLGLPEVTLGIIAGAGGTQRLVRAIGQGAARDLLLTGRQITGEEALRIGLVSRITARGEATELGLKIGMEIATGAAEAVQATKRLAVAASDNSIEVGLDQELAEWVKVRTSTNAAEGLSAFLEEAQAGLRLRSGEASVSSIARPDPPASARIEPGGRVRFVSPLVVLCAAQAILQLDFSIVNLALKTIQGELGFSNAGLQWVATSYALTFGSLLMLGGRLGDRVGRRRLLVTGLSIFGVASLACGVAGSAGLLIAARFVQGAAAALIAPTVLAMLTAIYDGPERTRALGVWAASLAVGGTAGLVAGGLLTEYLGWRSIFLVNLPVIAVLIPLALRVLPGGQGDRARALDPLSPALITLAIGSMIFGLTQCEQHIGSPSAWIPLFLSALLAFAFVRHERSAAEPMISFGFLAAPVRRTSAIAMFLVGGILSGYAFFIALSLQHVLGFSPAETAFAIFPAGVMMFLTSMVLAHRLIQGKGLKRTFLVGLGAAGLSMLAFSRITPQTDYATEILPALLLNAFGFGLLMPAASIGITRNVAPRDQGLAGGLVPTAQQVGAAVVLAIMATLAAATTRQHGGSLAAGYRVGFLGIVVIVIVCAVVVISTSFRAVEGQGDGSRVSLD